jgi:NodT family efflux transporter outer membrane factor (OMF) lipoprotein
VLTGCVTNQEGLPPPVNYPAAFSASGQTSAPSAWWTAFGDEQLNDLVELAFRDSLDLKTSWYRLQAARAASGRESAKLFPELSAFLAGDRREEENRTEEELELGLAASYEIDLWGGVQANADAERLQAKASAQDFQAAGLTLSAEIARTWVGLLSNRLQLDLLDDQVHANEQALHLLERRFAGGQSQSADVLRQRQLLAATRQERHQQTATLRLLEHRLAVLVGQPPQRVPAYEATALPGMPPLPESGVPLDLVRRRPDVQAAHARLQAANRETAVAVSQRFPRLSLSASYSTSETDAQSLFDDWILSLAGNLVTPLLDAGRRRADVARARAEEQQWLYEYGQIVLNAFQEVENALVLEAQQQLQMEQLEVQVSAASQAAEQLQTLYLNGAGNFIDVLAAQIDEQRSRRDLNDARRSLFEIRIGLYRALAGSLELDLEKDDDPQT